MTTERHSLALDATTFDLVRNTAHEFGMPQRILVRLAVEAYRKDGPKGKFVVEYRFEPINQSEARETPRIIGLPKGQQTLIKPHSQQPGDDLRS